MKYWNCVKVPTPSWAQPVEVVSDVDETENVEPVESTEEPAGDIASDPTSVLVTEGVDPATVEEVKDQMEREHYAQTVKEPVFSQEFTNMFNNAFSKHVEAVEMTAEEATAEPALLVGVDLAQNPDVSVEPVAGTDGYSVSVKVPDNPSGLMINENPVPISLNGISEVASGMGITIVENPVPITEPNTLVSPDEAASVVAVPEEKPGLSTDNLLAAIRNSAPGTETNGTVSGPISTGPTQQTEAPPVKKEEYALSEDNFKAAVKALTGWIKEYFPDMKVRYPISKRFIANIPKDVIDAHFDAVAKYELHPIMSPLFYFIPALAEEPFMEMGTFIDFVITSANTKENTDAILKSMDDRDAYYEKFADEDEEVEEDPDCPPDEESEEETKD